jgi:YD repeat-containing protein
VRYGYDELGNLKTVQSASAGAGGGKTVSYEYDHATGRKTKQINANGTEVDYAYDNMGNVHIITHKHGGAELLKLTYTRDKRGLITQLVEARNDGTLSETATWLYTYDDQKRLTHAGRTVGAATTNYDYTYDAAGNRLSKTEAGVHTAYSYNSLDQLATETPDGESAKTYLFDAWGNLVAVVKDRMKKTTQKAIRE